MRRCNARDIICSFFLPASRLMIAAIIFCSCLAGIGEVARAAESGRYVLVKTDIDRMKLTGTTDGEFSTATTRIGNGSFSYSYRSKDKNVTTKNTNWSYN